MKNKLLYDDIKKETENENICPECKIKMKKTKVGKSNKYSKSNVYYDCEICGFHHRKRTINEILRDLGEIE